MVSQVVLIREEPVQSLQGVRGQGFSDGTEASGLRSDLTQFPQATEAVVFIGKPLMLALARVLWKSIKPRGVLSLRPGEIKRVSGNLLAEKTSDGRIILYEVVE